MSRSGFRQRAALALVALALLLAGAAAASATTSSPPGTVRVLALVPSPGFPALPHVVGNRVFEGTYDNPKGTSAPSRVFEYSPSGALLHAWTVKGQNVQQPHGVQVAANDAKGRLLLLDKTSGRIIRLNPRTGAQRLYSQVPDLPTCSTAPQGTPCSPSVLNLSPMPDYAAWGPDGSLYVTDYQQAVIWRIPPGGGKARIWLADRRLDGGPFGTACVTMMPDHHTLLFDQASNGGLGALNPTTGKLYTVVIERDGKPGPLHELWHSGPAEAPDGCALARSGHIYVALVGTANQIVELDAQGHQVTRFGQEFTGADGSSVPFDSPSGLAFYGTELIVANQSYFADNPSNQALLELQTGELGLPVFVPKHAGERVKKHHHRCRHKHRKAHHRRH